MAPSVKVKPVKARVSDSAAADAIVTVPTAAIQQQLQQAFVSTLPPTTEPQWQQATQHFTDQTEKAHTLMINNMNDYSSLCRDMATASQQYCQIWTKGCEELSRSYASFCQNMMQDCMSAFKTTLSSRTVQDAVSSQSDFMRSQCEKIVSETTKMGEQFAKTASQAAEPVQSQWSKFTPAGTTLDSRAA